MKNTDSPNPNLDYSSDSSDYYLYDEEEKELLNFADDWLVSTCEEGRAPWDSDPVSIIKLLKDANETYGWNIPINEEYIKKKLANTDMKIKKKSRLYRQQHSNPRKENCEEKSARVSDFEAITSDSQTTQISDMVSDCEENMWMVNIDDKNSAGEITVADDLEKYRAPAAEPPQAGGGRDESVLFIRRTLNKTDISDHQNRLSMPCNQVNDEVLTGEEIGNLERSWWIPAKLIDPGNRIYDINLRRTQAGPTSCSYAIGKPWNEIKRKNGFETGMVLEIRGFRGDKGELCFVLERVG